MTLDKYFEEIESLAFQIQFSVLSGLSIVEFALSRNETVTNLLGLLKHETDLAEGLCRRIRYLLPRVSQETNLSYDESIVAYLYCLNKADLRLAYRASTLIWDTEGLLWSRWLAFKIIQLVQQVEQSLDFSSAASESGAHSVAQQYDYVDASSRLSSSHHLVAAYQQEYATYPAELSVES